MPSTSANPLPALGNELPLFCESCGYSLVGLPQQRCDACRVLQFHCPECGHHQPINTLRPAFQRILGRARAAWLCGVIFFKLNLLFWPLIGWVGMGTEWSYEYDRSNAASYTYHPTALRFEMIAGFCIFSLIYGSVTRMLLLRWRRGWCVGLVVSVLVLTAIAVGARIAQADHRMVQSPFTLDFLSLMALSALMITLGASIVWGIWTLVVRVFLPRSLADAVLAWQRFNPAPVSLLVRN